MYNHIHCRVCIRVKCTLAGPCDVGLTRLNKIFVILKLPSILCFTIIIQSGPVFSYFV